MKILQSWLRDYITFSIAPESLVERLTMTGLEFESVEFLGKKYERFVVGHIVDRQKHPNADRLSVCQVNVGKETLQIVCGAPNVAAGQKVAVGLIGAVIPKNMHKPDGKPFQLERVQLRGVESFGMICAEAELDLGPDTSGIMILDPKAKPGQSLAKYLGFDDVTFDVEITPNRPDWLSHMGIAREIGALTGKRAALPKIRLKEGSAPIRRFLSVHIEDRVNCRRFAARMIRGVKIGPSPEWLQQRLRNVGLRPRNNVVDVTNYVMLECGQPMHAFDYALPKGEGIVIRQAPEGTKFVTLDGKEHQLPAGAVMVCDKQREVSLAGIMGGENSEINDATVDIVLESANWNPASIRRTAKALGISTDASQRFERGADPNGVRYALDRAAELVLETAGGDLLKGALDVYPKKIKERVIPMRPDRVNSVLGTQLTSARMLQLLGNLEMRAVRKSKSVIGIKVPTYRVDVEQEIDLIEEIARIHGYDRIETKTHALIDFSHPFERNGIADSVRSQLVGQGFRDVITNPMQDEERSVARATTPVRIMNPLSKDMAVLRTSLIPGLLQVIAINQSRGNADLRLFEIGHVFRVDPSAPGRLVEDIVEEERVALAMTGSREPGSWGSSHRLVDLFDLKGVVDDFLRGLGLDNHRYISYPTSEGLTESTLGVEIQGSYVGSLSIVSPLVLSQYGVEGMIVVAELLTQMLRRGQRRPYVPLPRFPRVRRDVAFTIDRNTPSGNVEEEIRKSAGELLQGAGVFDVYEGKGLPDGCKSLAFALELMSREKTLTDDEIDAVVSRVVAHVEKTFGATLRGV